MPVIYVGLNPQTPLAVNNTSHAIKNSPTINIAGNKYLHVLKKATFLSKLNKKGKVTLNTSKIK